ncbi:MAG: hypothetical protein KY464_08535 [Gemmatimonadetes bacterium]|nr:hypothetical protein [Gemmatimonadota bacterium]
MPNAKWLPDGLRITSTPATTTSCHRVGRPQSGHVVGRRGSGGSSEHRVTNFAPGVKVQPFARSNLSFGVGVGIPLTDERDFDARALISAFFHF